MSKQPNFVFVIDTNRKPLTPCKPSVARRLLIRGKAAVFRLYPFTIILNKTVDATPEPLLLKLDPGSKGTGIAILKNDKLVFVADLIHRGQAIKNDLESRRAIRRGRRARKTRYRQPRFLNRRRPKGWLAPSLKHRVLTIQTWVEKLKRFAHIGAIAQELVRFDLQKIENPEISGIEYQQGTLKGFEVREYLLNKWERKCAYCKKEGVPLQVEHIHPKSKGGGDRISNLALACEKCNQKKGNQDINVFLDKKPADLKRVLAQAKAPLKDAASVNATRWDLFRTLQSTGLPVVTGSGGLTKFNRTRFELPKTHHFDAACVGDTSTLTVLVDQPLIIEAKGHGNRQRCLINKFGFPTLDKFGFPAKPRPQFKFVEGFQTGDIVKAVVSKGKKVGTHTGRVSVRSSGSFDITTGKRRVAGIGYANCQKIQSKDGYAYGFTNKITKT